MEEEKAIILISTHPELPMDMLRIGIDGTVHALFKGVNTGKGEFTKGGRLIITLYSGESINTKIEKNSFDGNYSKEGSSYSLRIITNMDLWDGYYIQGGKHEMWAAFSFAQKAYGIGYDSIGASIWIGVPAEGMIYNLIKYYIKQHEVDYSGVISGNGTVFKGTYFSGCGEFELLKVPSPLPEPKSLESIEGPLSTAKHNIEAIIGSTFLDCSNDLKEVSLDEMPKKSLYCVYFSAHWCPPCIHFSFSDIRSSIYTDSDGSL